jgi:glycosyltransferase involved in cell wall biosynthesis
MKREPVAIVHDYLIQMGGAERVVELLHRMYPSAPLYTSVVDRNRLPEGYSNADIRTSWLQWLPLISRYFKAAFMWYPLAFRMMRVDADVAIISSSGFSKWIRCAQGTKSICYCYTPPRFFWMREEYLKHEVNNPLLRKLLLCILGLFQRWDYTQAQKIDCLVAISQWVQQRIRECYGRESQIIYPPVNVKRFQVTEDHDGSYLIVSRLVGYKAIERAVHAFNRNGKILMIVGKGPDARRLKKMAEPNIIFKGGLSDPEVKQLMEQCYAVIFPGLEDFGMVPVEANACGKPVLAFGAGGALETILDGQTGVFYREPNVESLCAAVERMETIEWQPKMIRRQAERFSEERFLIEFKQIVDEWMPASADS